MTDTAALIVSAADLALQQGRLHVSFGLHYSSAACFPDDDRSEARFRLLERAERLAYLFTDLRAAWFIRLFIRDLQRSSPDPDQRTLQHTEPLRQWRLELGANRIALEALIPWQQQRLAPAQALQHLARLVQAHPESTAIAFALQQQLRRDGFVRDNGSLTCNHPIPRKLWLLRRHPAPCPELEVIETRWRDALPDWDVGWLDHPSETLIHDQRLPRLVRAAVHCVNDPLVRGDLLRLAMVWQFGGVAPAWNSAPHQPLEPLLQGVSLLLSQDHDLAINLDLLAATPRHPWVAQALEHACQNVLRGQGYSHWDLCGACLLSGVFARWAADDLATGHWPDGLRLITGPELHRWLQLHLPVVRPAELPAEPPLQSLLNHARRPGAQRWLAHGPFITLPPPTATEVEPTPAQQQELARCPSFDGLNLNWLPLHGQVHATLRSIRDRGRTPWIVDAGTHTGRSACWLAQHWSDAEVVCLVQRGEDAAAISRCLADTRVLGLLPADSRENVTSPEGVMEALVRRLRAQGGEPLLLHLDAAMEGFERLFADGGAWLQHFPLVLFHGALQTDPQGRLLPQPQHQALAAAGFDQLRSRDVLVAYQRRCLDHAVAISSGATDLPALQGALTRHGGVVAFDGEWQTPAITEGRACQLALQHLEPRADAVYVGFPWASLIDHLNNGTPRGRALLNQLQALLPSLEGKKRRITVCQQIFFQQHRWLFEQAGITDLFWSHATVHATMPGITMHPFPLYPVHWQSPTEQQDDQPRPIQYSFIGACSTPLYISNSRDLILKSLKGLPGSHIEGYQGWYYNDHVYGVQIRGTLAPDDPAVCGEERQQRQRRYVQILQQSVFALCPSGTGPNTIRLWEAIGCGAIPVVLSDRWRPPGPRELWEQAVLFLPDSADGVLSIPSLIQHCIADPDLLASKRHAMRKLWQLYGPEGFITDIQTLWQSL